MTKRGKRPSPVLGPESTPSTEEMEMANREVVETEQIEIRVLGEAHDVWVDPIAKDLLGSTVELPPGRQFKFTIVAGACPSLKEGVEITCGALDLMVDLVRTPLGGELTEVFCHIV